MAYAVIYGVTAAATSRRNSCDSNLNKGESSKPSPGNKTNPQQVKPQKLRKLQLVNECACVECTKIRSSSSNIETYESFKKSKFLTSTTYKTILKQSENNSTVVEQTSDNCALGELQRKQSPIFQRKTLKSSASFSLRKQQPFYASQSRDSTNHRGGRHRQEQGNRVDLSAIEAINMNTTNNLRNRTNSMRNGSMDINRNNGFTRNGTIMTSSNTEKREHLYKILVIGELGTGKTSFIKRYVHQFFSQNYRATIGVDFALKVLHWDPNTIVRLQLWDIAGQERFGNMTRVYYKEAVGAFIVFDVTRSGTFDCVSKWKEDLDSKVQLPDGSPIPCILLANKCDQEKQGIVAVSERMDEYVRENGFAGWFETSAKENVNIDEAARALVNKILLNDKLISDADVADTEKFNLNTSGEKMETDTKSKCSC